MNFRTISLVLVTTILFSSDLKAQVGSLEVIGGEGFNESTITTQILLTTDLPTHGFSFGVSHDPAIVSISSSTAIQVGPIMQALNDNSGPIFLDLNVEPDGGSGITVACITDYFTPFDVLPAMTSEPIIMIDYTINQNAPVGSVSPLTLTSTLGNPPVVTVLVLELTEVVPTLSAGSILVTEPHFIRGDLNQNGSLSLLDGVLLLYRVSGIEPPGSCLDADDINDDGILTIGDAVFLFQYMFAGGTPIPGSAGTCSPDLTPADSLDCVQFQFCE